MENTSPIPINNAFLMTLSEINAGQSIHDLSTELARVISAIRDTGRPGSITYRINLKPEGAGAKLKLLLEDEISVKLPKVPREKSFFFANDNNTLSRKDPRQGELNLKTVPSEEKPLKELPKDDTNIKTA